MSAISVDSIKSKSLVSFINKCRTIIQRAIVAVQSILYNDKKQHDRTKSV